MHISFALVASAASAPVNYIIGTQAIYGADWKAYNFTAKDVLREQVDGIAAMGGNQVKLRLAPSSTCAGYRLECSGQERSLTDLTRVGSVADTFAHKAFVWYQIWLYSFSNPNFLKQDWTDEALEKEYQETKDWASHMLNTYAGTGKVFMAGNWEGDWMLMGASGCKKDGKVDMSCDPTPEVLHRMVLWGQTRQRAIDDARQEVKANDVWIFYYMEMNLGPQAQGGKPGLTNDVLPKVNPDLVSYSSYAIRRAMIHSIVRCMAILMLSTTTTVALPTPTPSPAPVSSTSTTQLPSSQASTVERGPGVRIEALAKATEDREKHAAECNSAHGQIAENVVWLKKNGDLCLKAQDEHDMTGVLSRGDAIGKREQAAECYNREAAVLAAVDWLSTGECGRRTDKIHLSDAGKVDMCNGAKDYVAFRITWIKENGDRCMKAETQQHNMGLDVTVRAGYESTADECLFSVRGMFEAIDFFSANECAPASEVASAM